MATTVLATHVVVDPKVCGGLPRLDGTRIRVLDVVALHNRGLSPVEILDSYDSLTLAQVHAALAYYYDHRAELERQSRDLRRRVTALRRAHPRLAR